LKPLWVCSYTINILELFRIFRYWPDNTDPGHSLFSFEEDLKEVRSLERSKP